MVCPSSTFLRLVQAGLGTHYKRVVGFDPLLKLNLGFITDGVLGDSATRGLAQDPCQVIRSFVHVSVLCTLMLPW